MCLLPPLKTAGRHKHVSSALSSLWYLDLVLCTVLHLRWYKPFLHVCLTRFRFLTHVWFLSPTQIFKSSSARCVFLKYLTEKWAVIWTKSLQTYFSHIFKLLTRLCSCSGKGSNSLLSSEWHLHLLKTEKGLKFGTAKNKGCSIRLQNLECRHFIVHPCMVAHLWIFSQTQDGFPFVNCPCRTLPWFHSLHWKKKVKGPGHCYFFMNFLFCFSSGVLMSWTVFRSELRTSFTFPRGLSLVTEWITVTLWSELQKISNERQHKSDVPKWIFNRSIGITGCFVFDFAATSLKRPEISVNPILLKRKIKKRYIGEHFIWK